MGNVSADAGFEGYIVKGGGIVDAAEADLAGGQRAPDLRAKAKKLCGAFPLYPWM
jgi:hypothetical protein